MAGRHRVDRGQKGFSASHPAAVQDVAPNKLVDTAAPAGGLSSQEQKAVLWGTVFRVLGTPIMALLGLLNTAIIVRETGESIFGVVSLIATMSLLFPFADLGIGAVVTNASSRAGKLSEDPVTVGTIQRAYRVLAMIAAGLIVAFVLIMIFDKWGAVIGLTTGPDDRWVITLAASLFALSLPTGLGIRILIGINKNQLAVLVLMSNTVFGLLITVGLMLVGAQGIFFAIPGVFGALLGNIVGTIVALRMSGLGTVVFAAPVREMAQVKLLAGSLWMLIASVGLPLGLQSHRVILSHLSTPEELSRYALMAQVYALGWSVFSTAGMAYWPVFVKRRGDQAGTIKMWIKIVLVFFGVSVVAALFISLLGPFATNILSSGEVKTGTWLAVAFGCLLVVQCIHLPAGVLLTTPKEMRFQAFCIMGMGLISVVGGIVVAPEYGAVGVVFVAAAAVLVTQIVPDFAFVPRLVKRRDPVEVDQAESSGAVSV